MHQRTQHRAPLAGFFSPISDVFLNTVKPPPFTPKQQAIVARWPATLDKYNIAPMKVFLAQVIDELMRTLDKVTDVTARESVIGFGPSKALLGKIGDIEAQINPLVARMAKRMTFVNSKTGEGFTVVQFPHLRRDTLKLLSLTSALDFYVQIEGGPSWVGEGLLGVIDGFARSGAWIITTTAKVAKPIIALLSSADLIIWGGLGIIGAMWLRKRKGG